MSHPAPNCSPATQVLYDGSCPLCRREIAMYQQLRAEQPLAWVDVSSASYQPPSGLSRERLMKRFHVVTPQGVVLSGAAAFAWVWAGLPGWRHLAALARLPGVLAVMELAYRGFLPMRPALQALLRRFDVAHLPPELVRDIRSDHAGETGAVWIYRGILLVSRDRPLREFARQHLATEQKHLAAMEQLLPWGRRSKLLVPWRIAGFLTGLVPALLGPRWVYATIAAVETFVDHHYQAQLDILARLGPYPDLRRVLEEFQADECHHRDEAQAAIEATPSGPVRLWCLMVGRGSAVAVRLARLV